MVPEPRYIVKVKPGKGQPIPRHPYMNNNMPDAQGSYTFSFIIRRPMFPNKPVVGMCRYVEDFLDVYGKRNIELRKMDSLYEKKESDATRIDET